ncbi:hypothetical protein NKR23_g2543 [Pleurostoma richardsiae]|uniref:Uncharacterized protein n=1 Tax=Pleurostoma richardsiae TaxID=41990 RepID=A0AA38RR41_9PEZI|nr:hypothetical protein NKR23_g2543 [Pleurostoma richardsiae]
MQVIRAPSREPPRHPRSLFLAGSTSGAGPDWRASLTTALAASRAAAAAAVTVYDPARPDWDSTWREDPSFAPFREQVSWELEMQDRADVVIVFLHPGTRAAVSLMELGLCCGRRALRGGGGGVVVCCPEGYWKRGNVQIVCERYGVRCVGAEDELAGAVLDALAALEV